MVTNVVGKGISLHIGGVLPFGCVWGSGSSVAHVQVLDLALEAEFLIHQYLV